MQLIVNQQTVMRPKRKLIRRPVDVFHACPRCKGEVLKLAVDVLCVDCDWTSVEAYVEAGGMDDLFRAAREHFADVKEEEPAPQLDPPAAIQVPRRAGT